MANANQEEFEKKVDDLKSQIQNDISSNEDKIK